MTEFPLCEEMGLEPKAVFAFAFNSSEQVIKASDVEKMLQGGKITEVTQDFSWNEIKDSAGLWYVAKNTKSDVTKSITLTVPQKPKPVTKEEILEKLKSCVGYWDKLEPLIERIEKAGIE
jgi:hypothetical protein